MHFEKEDGCVILNMLLGQCAFGDEDHVDMLKRFWEVI